MLRNVVLCPYDGSQRGPMLFGCQCYSEYLVLCSAEESNVYLCENPDVQTSKAGRQQELEHHL